MIPLVMLKQGEKGKITRIAGGRRLVRRLAEMGLYLGAEVELLSGAERGPVVVGVNETRFGLGFGMARKIFVKPLR